jgi:fatty acid synthase
VPAFALAAGLAARFGILAALPFIPLLWLAVGAALCLACVLTKRNIGPRLFPRRPMPVFSGRFARWWLVGNPGHILHLKPCAHA